MEVVARVLNHSLYHATEGSRINQLSDEQQTTGKL